MQFWNINNICLSENRYEELRTDD